MTKFACRYAIVQFLPYTETGEFANVGIVLACPKTGHFGFKLQDRRYARITRFFDELESRVYTETIRDFGSELERIRQALPPNIDPEGLRRLFDQLIHPREAIIRFSSGRAVLTDDPEQAVHQLFSHYVERDFVTTEYVEKRIESRIRTLLKTLPLPVPFRDKRVGDEIYGVRFPFVQRQDDQATRIIKPFNLAHKEAQGIYDHGDAWVKKLERLQRNQSLPDEVLFAVELPPDTDAKRRAASEEIQRALSQLKVQVIPATAERQLIAFAEGVS